MMNRRAEIRKMVSQYHNIEISINGMPPAYMFRLRNIMSTGLGVLVRSDSDLLKQVEIGDVLDVKYNPTEPSEPSEYFKTKIEHITEGIADSPKGHAVMGLSII